MPSKREKITRRSVAALKLGETLTDTLIPGFSARRPRKHVLYALKMRNAGRQRHVAIGSEVDLTPDQARAEAEKLRAAKRQGLDPAAERDRRKHGQTFEAVAGRFMSQHVARKLRPTTQAFYRDMIDRILIPKFGRWRLDAIATSDVAAWHGRLHEKPTTANRALAVLSAAIGWAADQKLFAGDNPCASVKRYREAPINRYATPGQVAAILAAADELAEEGRISIFMARGLRVLALTGARRTEIFAARWEWYDAARADLVLPDSKSGGKRIALPAAAVAILDTLPRLERCPFIFPSLSRKRGTYEPFASFAKAWRHILDRADVGRWRIHDLRHAFASAAVEAGAPLYTVGQHLGHARPTTTARYAHVADDPKRAVAETVAAALGGAVNE